MIAVVMQAPTHAVSTPCEADAIDLRHLLAPEPLMRALGMARQLPQGGAFTVLTPRWPHPLLAALTELGLRHHGQLLADGSARIRIERPLATFLPG